MREKIIEWILKNVLIIRKYVFRKKDYHLLSLIDKNYSMEKFDKADISSKGNKFDIEEISIFDIIDRDDIRKYCTKITKFFYENRPQKALYYQDTNDIERTLLNHVNGQESFYNQLGVIEICDKNPLAEKINHIRINIVGTTRNYVIIEFRAGLRKQYKNKLSAYFMDDVKAVKERIKLTKHANPFKLSSWTIHCASRTSQKQNHIANEIKETTSDISKLLGTAFPIVLSNEVSFLPLIHVDTDIIPDTPDLDMFWNSIGYDDRLVLFLSEYRIAWQYAGDKYGFRITNRKRIEGFDQIYIDHDHPDHTLVPYYLILDGIKKYTEISFNKIKKFQNITTNSLRNNVDNDFLEIQKLYYKSNRMIKDFGHEFEEEELIKNFDAEKQRARINRFTKQLNWMNESLEETSDKLFNEVKSMETMISLMQSVYSRKLNQNVLILTFVSVLIGIISVLNNININTDTTALDKIIEGTIKIVELVITWFGKINNRV